MDLFPVTFKPFLVQWLVKIAGHWLQLKPLVKGAGGWVNLLKKKICDENLFKDNIEWSSKNLWKWYLLVKANKNKK